MNSHGVATATSRQRVYQFHHPDAHEDFYWKAEKNASKNSEKFFLSRKGHGTGVKKGLRGERLRNVSAPGGTRAAEGLALAMPRLYNTVGRCTF